MNRCHSYLGWGSDGFMPVRVGSAACFAGRLVVNKPEYQYSQINEVKK